MTIQIPDGGPPFEAELVEDSFTMLWLPQTNSCGKRIGLHTLLSAALKIRWRIVRASPEDRRLLEVHGFGSGKLPVMWLAHKRGR